MEASQNAPAARRGTPGIDIFQIAGKSISGWVPSQKTGNPERARIPFTSRMEERLGMYLDYHPHVRRYQRGDASPAFADAYRLTTPLGTPYPIPYVYDGTWHDYLPDYVGTLVDGKLLIAEAGLEEEKSKGKPLAKAEAARSRARERGGVYWIGTEKTLPLNRHYNLLYLHARRESFKTFPEIAPVLLSNWLWGDFRSVKEFVKLLGGRWPEEEVEAAVWKIAGDAAAVGRLMVDLTKVELTLSTPLALLDPDAPPILPDPLPSSLEADGQEGGERPPPAESDSDAPLKIGSVIQGPTIDTSDWEEEARQRFENKLTAATKVLSGERLRRVAIECKIAPSALSRLVKRVAEFGQLACVSYEVRQSRLQLLPELQHLIRKLYTNPLRPTIKAVHEDVQLKDLAEILAKKKGYPVPSPSYRQVTYYIESISQEEG